MKKRIFQVLLILLALLGGLLLPRGERPARTVVHQHRSWPAESAAATGWNDDGTLTSHLPLVILHTNGQTVPGENRSNTAVLSCTYEIIWNDSGVNCSADAPRQQGLCQLSIRGNSSRLLPKKQYSFKLVDEHGLPRDESMLGMPAESTWVLNGSFIDHSMIRNYMIYNLAGEIMDYAPRTRLCEVFLTDAAGRAVYQGVYTMIEKPKVSPARLNLPEYDPKFAATSWLAQMNAHIDVENNVYIDDNTIPHLLPDNITAFRLGLEYPAPELVTQASYDYVAGQVLQMDRVLYDSIHTHDWERVSRYLDLDSFVDYYLINEFFQNYDAGNISTYFYCSAGGKIHIGPVWDFDGSMDNFFVEVGRDELRLQNSFYLNYLAQNKDFSDRCIARYYQLRRTVLSEEYLLGYLDDAAAYLHGPAQRNCRRWYPDNPEAFDRDIEHMKQFVTERIEWLDRNFESFFRVTE